MQSIEYKIYGPKFHKALKDADELYTNFVLKGQNDDVLQIDKLANRLSFLTNILEVELINSKCCLETIGEAKRIIKKLIRFYLSEKQAPYNFKNVVAHGIVCFLKIAEIELSDEYMKTFANYFQEEIEFSKTFIKKVNLPEFWYF